MTDDALTPGELIRQEMRARGWWAHELPAHLRLSAAETLDLVCDQLPVDAWIASHLAAAFGTSAALWLNLYAQSQRDADAG